MSRFASDGCCVVFLCRGSFPRLEICGKYQTAGETHTLTGSSFLFVGIGQSRFDWNILGAHTVNMFELVLPRYGKTVWTLEETSQFGPPSVEERRVEAKKKSESRYARRIARHRFHRIVRAANVQYLSSWRHRIELLQPIARVREPHGSHKCPPKDTYDLGRFAAPSSELTMTRRTGSRDKCMCQFRCAAVHSNAA